MMIETKNYHCLSEARQEDKVKFANILMDIVSSKDFHKFDPSGLKFFLYTLYDRYSSGLPLELDYHSIEAFKSFD